MNEKEKIRLTMFLNNIKYDLRIASDNKLYQKWAKDNQGFKLFKDYVFSEYKRKIDLVFT